MASSPAALAIPVLLACGTAACGQTWTVRVLHPAHARESVVRVVSGKDHAGTCTLPDGAFQAGVWSGRTGAWTPLSEPGVQSFCYGGEGIQQVGVFVSPTIPSRAGLWRGSAESRIDLHPDGATYSGAEDARGDMQVGGGLYAGLSRAGFWRGTRESFVDLHPAGAVESTALATDGALQGGQVLWPGSSSWRAALWAGTPGSVVDLGPNDGPSMVVDMAPGVQVGEALFASAQRAALWRGTRESFTDLTPTGASTATFKGTTGRVHAGRFPQGPLVRAGINFGTPDSWVGLHQYLPPEFSLWSSAEAIHQEGPTIYVGGWADSTLTEYKKAILWVGTDPCYANCDSSTANPILNVSDFLCFQTKFASGDPYANCDGSTAEPTLNVNDFICFQTQFAQGCP